jgi:DNA-binding NarL/FixJ family response regulator
MGSGNEVEASMAAIARGAKGYINENATISEFVSAVRVVSEELLWASRKVFSLIIDRYSTPSKRILSAKTLTSRERQVLEMLWLAGPTRRLPRLLVSRSVRSRRMCRR